MNKDIAKQIEKQGIKINKDRLLDLIRKISDRELACIHDGNQLVVVIKHKGQL